MVKTCLTQAARKIISRPQSTRRKPFQTMLDSHGRDTARCAHPSRFAKGVSLPETRCKNVDAMRLGLTRVRHAVRTTCPSISGGEPFLRWACPYQTHLALIDTLVAIYAILE